MKISGCSPRNVCSAVVPHLGAPTRKKSGERLMTLQRSGSRCPSVRAHVPDDAGGDGESVCDPLDDLVVPRSDLGLRSAVGDESGGELLLGDVAIAFLEEIPERR